MHTHTQSCRVKPILHFQLHLLRDFLQEKMPPFIASHFLKVSGTLLCCMQVYWYGEGMGDKIVIYLFFVCGNSTKSLLLTRSFTGNINSPLTHFWCYVHYTLYSYNKVSSRIENMLIR